MTKSMPEGVVTYHRQVLAMPPQWERSLSLLSCLHVDSEGTIEDHGHGMLQARKSVIIEFLTKHSLSLYTPNSVTCILYVCTG